MFAKFKREKKRPSYPSPTRQWQGLIAILVSIAVIEFISSNFERLRNPAGILALIVMYVTHWSGLRMGMICSAIIFAYLLHAYSVPGTLFEYTPQAVRRLINAAIGLPLYVLIVGGVGGKLRNARIQEFDAKDRAKEEEKQRLSAEADLQSSEEMRRLVIDSAMDAIIAYREDGVITLWNPSATRKFGWTSEEAVGRHFSEMIIRPPDRDGDETDKLVGERLEMTGRAKGGREFPIELSMAQHNGPEGSIFIAFVRDVTEQRKLNERLRQAQKMEAIGTLAGGIAHDFNNVLAAISGNVLLAKADAPPNSPAQESLGEIEKSVERATNIVRQILTFSRANEPDSHVVDLAPILDDAVHLLRATIPATMEIEFNVPQGLPPVSADATDIHQIVLNLGINAFQSLKGQNGKFEIQATAVDLDETTAKDLMGLLPGTYARLSFGDTGCGMDAETLERIFEPFFTTKGAGEGTGLGLAVVYGIVGRHGGAISPYSEPGKGTVFHVYLPIAESTSPRKEVEPTMLTPGNGEKLLYVDDDETLVFMMKRMLGRLNYIVEAFTDPSEGLAAFKGDPFGFDLVITDMSMPYMNGPALVGELQAVRPDVPIVMVTGYIRPDDLEQARHLGIRELILKPNTVDEMSDVLARVIAEEREMRTAV